MDPTTHVATLPQLAGHPVVTDGGLETDLIYHHGVDLPDFAAFVLVDDEHGRACCRATTRRTSTSPAGPARRSSWRRPRGGPAATGATASATRPPTCAG